MALLTYLVKVSEDDRSVVYRFGPREDELQMGLIELDKLTERFRELEPLPGATTQTHFNCAAKKLTKLWSQGEGFPERTYYAA